MAADATGVNPAAVSGRMDCREENPNILFNAILSSFMTAAQSLKAKVLLCDTS